MQIALADNEQDQNWHGENLTFSSPTVALRKIPPLKISIWMRRESLIGTKDPVSQESLTVG